MGRPQRKAIKRLQIRINNYEAMKKRSRFGGIEYTKPGSQKK